MSTSTAKSMNVIIVGGSLGGLFTGLILKRLGHNIRILERSPTTLLHTQGAGIVAGGETQSFFSRHDLTHTPIAVVSPLRHYLDREGNEIHREEYEQRMTSWDLLYNVLRANFDGRRSEYCGVASEEGREGDGMAVYETGCTVTELQRDDGEEDGDITVHYTTVTTHDNNNNNPTQTHTHTATASLIIAADGPSSTIRSLLTPNITRTYAGYVAWRGTVPETSLTPSASSAFIEKFTFYHAEGLQILAYVIPGANGTLEKGKRLVNWVWYCNYAKDSDEYRELMTDENDVLHHYTLHAGAMRPSIWTEQKARAEKTLPPQFAELVRLTEEPFVQAITDVMSEGNVFWGGRVLMVGDAVAGFRPHTAASTSQAAFDALALEEVFSGLGGVGGGWVGGGKEGSGQHRGEMERGLRDWERKTMEFARRVQRKGVELGERSQFGRHPLAG